MVHFLNYSILSFSQLFQQHKFIHVDLVRVSIAEIHARCVQYCFSIEVESTARISDSIQSKNQRTFLLEPSTQSQSTNTYTNFAKLEKGLENVPSWDKVMGLSSLNFGCNRRPDMFDGFIFAGISRKGDRERSLCPL